MIGGSRVMREVYRISVVNSAKYELDEPSAKNFCPINSQIVHLEWVGLHNRKHCAGHVFQDIKLRIRATKTCSISPVAPL
jgi:hypothetical protein